MKLQSIIFSIIILISYQISSTKVQNEKNPKLKDRLITTSMMAGLGGTLGYNSLEQLNKNDFINTDQKKLISSFIQDDKILYDKVKSIDFNDLKKKVKYYKLLRNLNNSNNQNQLNQGFVNEVSIKIDEIGFFNNWNQKITLDPIGFCDYTYYKNNPLLYTSKNPCLMHYDILLFHYSIIDTAKTLKINMNLNDIYIPTYKKCDTAKQRLITTEELNRLINEIANNRPQSNKCKEILDKHLITLIYFPKERVINMIKIIYKLNEKIDKLIEIESNLNSFNLENKINYIDACFLTDDKKQLNQKNLKLLKKIHNFIKYIPNIHNQLKNNSELLNQWTDFITMITNRLSQPQVLPHKKNKDSIVPYNLFEFPSQASKYNEDIAMQIINNIEDVFYNIQFSKS